MISKFIIRHLAHFNVKTYKYVNTQYTYNGYFKHFSEKEGNDIIKYLYIL